MKPTKKPIVRSLMMIKQMRGLGGYLELIWEARDIQQAKRNEARLEIWAAKRLGAG